MTCHRLTSPDTGRVMGILCTRGPARKQKCGVLIGGRKCGESAELLCDGCDVVLCLPHRVKVIRSGPELGDLAFDFCPACFEPVFRAWVREHGRTLSQAQRRVEFRAFARAHPEAFDGIKLSAQAPDPARRPR